MIYQSIFSGIIETLNYRTKFHAFVMVRVSERLGRHMELSNSLNGHSLSFKNSTIREQLTLDSSSTYISLYPFIKENSLDAVPSVL